MKEKTWKIILIIWMVSINFLLLDIRNTLKTQTKLMEIEPTEFRSEPEPVPEFQKQIFTISAYTPRKQETDKDPHNTATMEKPIPGWTCAVSQDYLHWLGGRVYIPGIGVRKVNDLMHPRYEKTIDLFMGKVPHAKEFGKRQLHAVYLGR